MIQTHTICTGAGKKLEDFTYNDSEMAQLIYKTLLNVTFQGVRGQIAFDENGDIVGQIKFDRVQGGKKRTVGLYNTSFPLNVSVNSFR